MGVGSGRKKGTKSTGWIRDTVLRIYTEDQVKQDWFAISPVDRLKIIASWVPRDINSMNNNGLQVNIVLSGIEAKRVITVDTIPQDALPEHDAE